MEDFPYYIQKTKRKVNWDKPYHSIVGRHIVASIMKLILGLGKMGTTVSVPDAIRRSNESLQVQNKRKKGVDYFIVLS